MRGYSICMNKLPPEKMKKLKEYFAKREDVAFAFLFGSYAKGTASSRRSDVDVGVYFVSHLNSNEEEIDRLRHEVWSDIDSLFPAETEVIALNTAPAPFVFEVFRTGMPLVIKNPSLYTDRLIEVSSEAIDFMRDAEDYHAIFMRSASLSSNDRFRLVRRLNFLEHALLEVHRFRQMSQGEYMDEQNPDRRRSVERWVENIVNCSIDIAKILLASHKVRLPDTYKDMLLGLHWQLHLDEKVARKLAELADLRNIVAHQYLDMLFVEIRRFLDNAEPFYKTLAEFARGFLEKQEKEQK